MIEDEKKIHEMKTEPRKSSRTQITEKRKSVKEKSRDMEDRSTAPPSAQEEFQEETRKAGGRHHPQTDRHMQKHTLRPQNTYTHTLRKIFPKLKRKKCRFSGWKRK